MLIYKIYFNLLSGYIGFFVFGISGISGMGIAGVFSGALRALVRGLWPQGPACAAPSLVL